MKNEWDDYAVGWDTDASVKEYATKAFSTLAEVVNVDGLSVLDFGCGTGQLTELLSPKVKNIVSLDGSPEMIKRLSKKGLKNVATISGFLTQELIGTHPLLQNKFDLIVASSVCGFLPDYEATLGLLKSLLNSHGVFIQWDWLATDESPTGLTTAVVKQALEEAGFVDINITQPFDMSNEKGAMTVLMAIAK